MNMPKRGLYAITQTDDKSLETIIEEVAAAIRGGAVMVQYRDKNPSDALKLAKALLETCHAGNVPLIVNDDIELAAAIGADGVHLGKDDADIVLARHRIGVNCIVGISCYDSIDRALQAERLGASYAAFGRFFASGTKPLASLAKLETLKLAKQKLTIPIVAIGGILPETGKLLIDAGADFLAVVGSLYGRDTEQSAKMFNSLFEQTNP